MMKDAINKFPEQFAYIPEIENENNLLKKSKVVVCGMGGSHLAGDVLKDIDPSLRVHIHSSYGLPSWKDSELEQSLIIASSYSGNTEEVLDAYDQARAKKLPLAAIAVGGKLLEKAKADGVPYITLPSTGIQPRSALGFSFLALVKMIGNVELMREAKELSVSLNPGRIEDEGKKLATELAGKVPVIYTAANNYSVAYNWKIKLNETGKIPAFYNLLPELNHNEMTGFDVTDASKQLSEKFHFIILRDEYDHERIQKRMDVMEKLYTDRGLSVTRLDLQGANRLEKIFGSLLMADWTAVYVAEHYGHESEQVPMVEEFKKMI
ncbi:MAG: bifunctional phosphoglucose/phosphomannose isomerase [Patescibacteria group bacterium]